MHPVPCTRYVPSNEKFVGYRTLLITMGDVEGEWEGGRARQW